MSSFSNPFFDLDSPPSKSSSSGKSENSAFVDLTSDTEDDEKDEKAEQERLEMDSRLAHLLNDYDVGYREQTEDDEIEEGEEVNLDVLTADLLDIEGGWNFEFKKLMKHMLIHSLRMAFDEKDNNLAISKALQPWLAEKTEVDSFIVSDDRVRDADKLIKRILLLMASTRHSAQRLNKIAVRLSTLLKRYLGIFQLLDKGNWMEEVRGNSIHSDFLTLILEWIQAGRVYCFLNAASITLKDEKLEILKKGIFAYWMGYCKLVYIFLACIRYFHLEADFYDENPVLVVSSGQDNRNRTGPYQIETVTIETRDEFLSFVNSAAKVINDPQMKFYVTKEDPNTHEKVNKILTSVTLNNLKVTLSQYQENQASQVREKIKTLLEYLQHSSSVRLMDGHVVQVKKTKLDPSQPLRGEVRWELSKSFRDIIFSNAQLGWFLNSVRLVGYLDNEEAQLHLEGAQDNRFIRIDTERKKKAYLEAKAKRARIADVGAVIRTPRRGEEGVSGVPPQTPRVPYVPIRLFAPSSTSNTTTTTTTTTSRNPSSNSMEDMSKAMSSMRVTSSSSSLSIKMDGQEVTLI